MKLKLIQLAALLVVVLAMTALALGQDKAAGHQQE